MHIISSTYFHKNLQKNVILIVLCYVENHLQFLIYKLTHFASSINLEFKKLSDLFQGLKYLLTTNSNFYIVLKLVLLVSLFFICQPSLAILNFS